MQCNDEEKGTVAFACMIKIQTVLFSRWSKHVTSKVLLQALAPGGRFSVARLSYKTMCRWK